MDLIFISVIIVMLSGLAFLITSSSKQLKEKSMPSFLTLSIAFGIFFTYFFGFVRSFFPHMPEIDSFLWKLSGISGSISSTAFIVLAGIWTFFAKKSSQSAMKTIVFIYFILIAISFLAFEPVRQVSPEGFVEWNLALATKILVYLASLITLIASMLSIYFGIKKKNKKPILFGIGIFLGLLGLLLDGEGLIDYIYLYRLIASSGIWLMLISSQMKG